MLFSADYFRGHRLEHRARLQLSNGILALAHLPLRFGAVRRGGMSPALVHVSMFSAAFAMFVCGCPAPFLPTCPPARQWYRSHSLNPAAVVAQPCAPERADNTGEITKSEHSR